MLIYSIWLAFTTSQQILPLNLHTIEITAVNIEVKIQNQLNERIKKIFGIDKETHLPECSYLCLANELCLENALSH